MATSDSSTKPIFPVYNTPVFSSSHKELAAIVKLSEVKVKYSVPERQAPYILEFSGIGHDHFIKAKRNPDTHTVAP